MKLTLDERVKHRLIGLAVMFSIAAIFAPAMIKKSNQRLDENTTLFVRLPAKPTLPKVVMPEEQAMFKRVKVTKAEVPKVPSGPTELTLSKAESLKPNKEQDLEKTQLVTIQEKKLQQPTVQDISNDEDISTHSDSSINPIKTIPSIPLRSKVSKSNKILDNKKKSLSFSDKRSPKNAIKLVSNARKESYLVQLASFSKKQNAESLTSRLRARGYQASYNKVTTAKGMVYKVVVGQTAEKQQAQILQKQLAAATRLNGLIVSTSMG